MALEHLLEALLLDQAEGHVESLHEPDRGRERAVGRVLALAVHRALPVEVVAARRDARSRVRARPRPGLAKPRPGGAISAFCDPDTTTSSPCRPAGAARRLPPRRRQPRSEPRGARDLCEGCMSLTTPVEVSDRVVKTTLASGCWPSSRSSSAGSTLVPQPPRGGRWPRHRRRTARPSARRTCRRTPPARLARADEVGHGGLHGARARGREHAARRSRSRRRPEPLQRARIDLNEGRGAVVEHRLRHRQRHGGRKRRGPGASSDTASRRGWPSDGRG